MVFMQFMVTASAQYTAGAYTNNPVIIQVPLYGKYRTRIISIQYFGATNTMIQLQSRQFAMPLVGSDKGGTNIAARYPYLLIGTDNSSNPPVIGTHPWEFYIDWDGVFEYVLYDILAGKPMALNPGSFNVLINLDVEPVENNVHPQFNPSVTNMSHTFSQIPTRTYGK